MHLVITDLPFSFAVTAQFLNQVMGFALSAPDITATWRWPAFDCLGTVYHEMAAFQARSQALEAS